MRVVFSMSSQFFKLADFFKIYLRRNYLIKDNVSTKFYESINFLLNSFYENNLYNYKWLYSAHLDRNYKAIIYAYKKDLRLLHVIRLLCNYIYVPRDHNLWLVVL